MGELSGGVAAPLPPPGGGPSENGWAAEWLYGCMYIIYVYFVPEETVLALPRESLMMCGVAR